jgi:hypothetical protein
MHPDAAASIQQLLKLLCAIEDLASCTPVSVGEIEEWAAIVRSADDSSESYCKAPRSKALFSALYETYAVTLKELKNVLKASSQAGQTKQEDSFKEVRNQNRHCTREEACTPKKGALPTSTVTVATKNFFAPFLTTNMNTDAPVTESKSTEAEATGKSGRPPPIILTPAANLMHLQELKGVAKQSFEFRSTKNGTRVVTKNMADYPAVKTFFNDHTLSDYTFYLKVEKPIKAVIRHLPINTPAEYIADGLK